MTILKMQVPIERLVLKTCGDKLPYGRAFMWTNERTPITKFKLTIDNAVSEALNPMESVNSTFLETIHIYYLSIEKIKKYELRYSLTRMTYDKDGIIDNKDLARWDYLIIDAKCDGRINLLEARITALINELHPQSLNAQFEVYAVKSPSTKGGEK